MTVFGVAVVAVGVAFAMFVERGLRGSEPGETVVGKGLLVEEGVTGRVSHYVHLKDFG